MAARHAQTWSIWSFLLFLWLFLTNGTLYQSSKTVKTVKNSQTTVKTEKNDHWCTNRHMSTQSPPNTRVHKAAQTPLPCETSITRAWAVATARRPWAGLTVCVYTWTSMHLAFVRCRVLLHSLLPTDDACSSSSLSTTVIKFSIFSDPTRKLSAFPPELRRIR